LLHKGGYPGSARCSSENQRLCGPATKGVSNATPRSQVTFLRDTALTALADRNMLQFMNQGLVKKTKAGRQNRTKRHFGTARVLTVEEALRMKEDKREKEQRVMQEKEEAAALRGKTHNRNLHSNLS
jgi:hypothetical protein